MTHNQTITATSALVVLVDCEPEEKVDGVTWAGSKAGTEKVRIFSARDSGRDAPPNGQGALLQTGTAHYQLRLR